MYLKLTDNQLFIDNSSINTYGTCAKLAQFSVVAKRRKKISKPALNFGGAVHKGLDVRYRSSNPMPDSKMEIEQAEAIEDFYQKNPHPENDYRNLGTAVQLMRSYNQNYKFEKFKVATMPDGSPAVELPFAIPLGRINFEAPIRVLNNGVLTEVDYVDIVFTGRIDAIIIHNGDNQYGVMDHKTTSRGGPQFFKEFYTSLQFKGYCWAAMHLLDKPILSVLINGLIARPPTKAKAYNFDFIRDRIPYTMPLLDDWKENFWCLIEDFFHCYQREFFPMETAWCVGKYGQCEFYDVCVLPPASRLMMLNSGLYEDNNWSPLEDVEEKTKKEVFLP